MVQGLDGVIVPLVDGDGQRSQTGSAELFTELGIGGGVEDHVGVELHQLLDIDVRAVNIAGLGLEDLRIELAEQTALCGKHAGGRHADDLLRGVKEHGQNGGQRIDVADGDALDVIGHGDLVAVVVNDDVRSGGCVGFVFFAL